MSTYQPDAPIAPAEDVNRGTIVALLAIPIGVIVFVLVWTLGFIASIISLGVAYLATFLYQLGSGGTMSRAGAVRVTFITIVTIALSIFAGLVADVAIGVGRMSDISPFEALGLPSFWRIFEESIAGADGSLWMSVAIAVVFGLLGCFGILRNAFRATAAPAPGFDATTLPPLPPQQPQPQYPGENGSAESDPTAPRP